MTSRREWTWKCSESVEEGGMASIASGRQFRCRAGRVDPVHPGEHLGDGDVQRYGDPCVEIDLQKQRYELRRLVDEYPRGACPADDLLGDIAAAPRDDD